MRPPHSFAAAGGPQGPDSHLQLRPPPSFSDARNLSPDGNGREGPYDTFISGLLGGYIVFGRRKSSVSQQVSLEDVAKQSPSAHMRYGRVTRN